MAKRKESARPTNNPFAGRWTYRSFNHIPDIEIDYNELELARGILIIHDFPLGSFSGRLSFSDTLQYELTGSSSFGNPFTIRFQGKGDAIGSKGHLYDYVGYLEPIWPNGVAQLPVIVGSVIRTLPHDKRPAGVVASWIAMRQL